MKSRLKAALNAFSLGALAFAAPGCASSETPKDAPAWYVEAIRDDHSTFPSLTDVPKATDANLDAAHWAAVEADLRAALTELRADPRSQATAGDNAADFDAAARREIDATRDAHN